MRARFARLLQESFLPVMLVLFALFMVLVYSEYRVTRDAEQTIVIDIPEVISTQALTESAEAEIGQAAVLPSVQLADPRMAEVNALIDKQQYGQAEKAVRAILKDRPGSQAWYQLARIHYGRKQTQAALRALDTAVNTPPVHLSAYFLRGVIRAGEKQYQRALEDYSQILEKIPFHFEAQFNSGLAWLKQNNYANAIDAFQRAADTSGGRRRARALYNLAIAYRDASHIERTVRYRIAHEHLIASIRLFPAYTRARFVLATLEPKTAQGYQNRLEIYQDVLNLEPNSPEVYYRIARTHRSLKDEKAALKAVNLALRFNPRHIRARELRGDMYKSAKRYREAFADFERLLTLDPENHQVEFQLGHILFLKRDYDGALDFFNAALKKKPAFDEAWLNIGLIYARKKQYTQAHKAYAQAIKIRPDYPQAFFNRGRLYMAQKNYPAAEADLKKAIQLRKRYPQAWYNLGLIYGRQDLHQQAADAYQQALAERPDYPKAAINLAIRYARLEQDDRAIETYRQLLDKDPSYVRAWLNIGIAYRRQKQYTEALRAFEQAVKLEPDNNKAVYNLARTHASLKQYNRAIDHYSRLVDREAGNTSYRLGYARALAADGQKKQARQELEKGLRISPDNPKLMDELNKLK